MLVRTDAAGATKEFAAHLDERGVEFSVGASVARCLMAPLTDRVADGPADREASIMTTPQPAPGGGPPRRFQLSQRDLLILILAQAAGISAGLLPASTGPALGHAVIGGVAAFGPTLYFLDRIVE